MNAQNQTKAYQQGPQQGYQHVPQPGSPTYTEAWALIEAARRMAVAIESNPADDIKSRNAIRETLRLNWRLWTIFQAELTVGNSKVPEDLRENMLTLCKFVDNHTVETMSDLTPENTAVPANADTIVLNGITFTFTTNEAADSMGADTVIFRDGPLDQVLADLRSAIAANDLEFDTNSVTLRGTGSPDDNTLILNSKSNGSTYTFSVAGLTSNPTAPDGTSTFISSNLITIQTEPAISFTCSGLPNTFNIAELDIRNFSNGAANFDDDANNAKQITIDFGTLGEANGVTQFGASFTPVFINQKGPASAPSPGSPSTPAA